MWEMDHYENWMPMNLWFWTVMLDCEEIQPVHPKGLNISPEYSLEGLMLKLRLQNFGHLMQRADSLEKTLMLGKIEGRRRGQQKMRWFEWHHRFNGHEFEQTPGDSGGQGSLLCCSPWDHKESDTTEWLIWCHNALYLFNWSSFFLLVIVTSIN